MSDEQSQTTQTRNRTDSSHVSMDERNVVSTTNHTDKRKKKDRGTNLVGKAILHAKVGVLLPKVER